MLVVIETHPVQYHAPVYRAVVEKFGVPVTAIYGSDFSVAGYHDRGFGATFKWDTDLLAGYESRFLARARDGVSGPEAVTAGGVRRALAELRPDAVLITGYSPRFHRTAWFEARRAGCPVLFRAETSDDTDTRGPLARRFKSGALGLAYRTCERILFIGERSHAHYERLGVPAQRLVFSPYCVDTTPFRTTEDDRAALRATVRRDLDIDESALVLLFAGKLIPAKGVDLIAHAVADLPDAIRSRVVVLWLGEGERRGALAYAPGVSSRFVGFQNQRQLSPYYHAADLLLLPSRCSETWGLVVNEALHHGLPCVVSDRVGCAPDLIDAGVTGVIHAADSPAALQESIEAASPLVGRLDVREACRRKVEPYSVVAAAAGLALAYAQATMAGATRRAG